MPELATQVLAGWGAALSTALAALQFHSWWRDRFRIEVSYQFTGCDDIGNQIYIRNLSATPLILTYWELQWRSGWPLLTSVSRTHQPDAHDHSDVRIEARSTHILSFVGPDYFDCGVGASKGDTIYIELRFAGRRSIVRKKVYSPRDRML